VDHTPPGIRRLCIAFGLEPSDGLDGDMLAVAEQQLSTAFAGVCASLGLDRMLLNRRTNDGLQVGLLPVGIDEPRVVSSLVEGLSGTLATLNVQQATRACVRLRLAFHEGVTMLEAEGFSGNAVTRVRQLAESSQLRAALSQHPRGSLAVVISDPVFQDIGHPGYPSLPLERFQRVEIADPRGTPCASAWIYVPGHGD
jgi:hypothetical protein